MTKWIVSGLFLIGAGIFMAVLFPAQLGVIVGVFLIAAAGTIFDRLFRK